MTASTSYIPLGNAVDLINGDRGHNYPDRDAQLPYGYCLFLNTKNVRQGYFDFTDVAFIDKQRHASLGGGTLQRNDIVLTIRGTLGNTAIYRDDVPYEVVRINSAMLVLRPNQFFEPDFIERFLRSSGFVDWVGLNQRGSAQPHLRTVDIETAQLPLVSKEQQRRIVAKIDSLCGKCKRTRDRVGHIPRLVEKYKQAILATAFRGELTHPWRQRSEQSAAQTLSEVRSERSSTELSPRRRAALSNLPKPPSQLPGLPATWVWACIEELAADDNRAIQSGPFGSSLLHSEFQASGYLVIGIDNVQDGNFSLGSQNRIKEAKVLELERFRARPQDVLVTVMATIGRTCVLPDQVEPAIITKHVYRMTVDKRLVLPHYLMNALRGSEVVLEQMGANVRGQTRPGLNGTIMKSIHIPLAPLDEQIEILRVIDSSFAWIDRLASEAANARRLIDHLDQAVLAKAFQGELVLQDPSDEPASVLLERIRAERASASEKPVAGLKTGQQLRARKVASKT